MRCQPFEYKEPRRCIPIRLNGSAVTNSRGQREWDAANIGGSGKLEMRIFRQSLCGVVVLASNSALWINML